MNLANAFTNYLNSRYNHLSKKTVRNYRVDIDSFVRWYDEKFNVSLDIDPSWINSDTVEAYKKEKILESNLSPATLKRHFSSLRKLFEFLKTEEIIQEDPFEVKSLSDQQSNQKDKWYLRRFKNYLSLNDISNVTIKNYIFDIQRFFIWGQNLIGEDILNNIEQALFEYRKFLVKKGLSPKTIKRNFSSLQKYLGWIRTEVDVEISNVKGQMSKVKSDVTISGLRKLPSEQFKQTEKTRSEYSPFPPLRLVQKIIKVVNILFDLILVAPIAKTVDSLNYSLHKITGAPIFVDIPSVSSQFRIQKLEIRSYPGPFPWHKKIIHHIRHTRPKWYKIYHSYSITDYFHLSILILSMSILGFAVYQNITPIQEQSVLSSFTAYSPRILSFNGELTDDLGNPITRVNTPLRVAIYNHAHTFGSALLWQETINVNPDENGYFSSLIGTSTPIPPSVFSEGDALWLGVAIADSPELSPRQQLSNVALAKDSEKLQGLSPNTISSETKNVILALDSSGDLTIGGNASPTFQATGGSFRLLGETLILSTTPGTNSNVEVAPMDLGKIDLQKPIFNSTNNNNVSQAIGSVEIDDSLAVLATTSAQSAFTVSQNSTGNLIGAFAFGIEKFVINNSGDIISGTGSKWQPFSDSTSALSIANAAGNSFITFDTENYRLRFLQDSVERGEIFYLGSDSAFHIRSASSLAFSTGNSDDSKVYIASSGNVGINTTNPGFRLDVYDSQESSAAAQIFNTSTSSDADGLIIKLGNDSATVDNNNRFLSFETSGIGIVGSIRGDGTTGVEYKTEGIADFAEYIKKDKSQSIEYGSVICIDDKGQALPCDDNYKKIIGVSSNQGGFTGGKDRGEETVRVGFVGQVYTRVSAVNGEIKPGDPLTSSSTPGVAVKATSTGPIVGKALESFTDGNTSEVCSGRSLTSEVKVLCGKILVSVNVSWYDPITLASSQNLLEENFKDRVFTIFEEFVKSSKIISPVTDSIYVDSDIVSPLPSNNLATNINNTPDAQASDSAALEPDLDQQQVSTPEAQYVQNTQIPEHSENSVNQNQSDKSENQKHQNSDFPRISDFLKHWRTEYSEFSEDLPLFSQGFISFGPASLSDTSINGQLSIGSPTGGIKLTRNTINVFGTDLSLQPLRQGGLSIMGDLVYIDTQGNLKVGGNAEFAKNVNVGGDFTVYGKTTLNKLNLNLVKEVIAVSKKELIATGAAGTAFVQSNETEVTIKNPLVSGESLIYITPAGTPSGQIPYLIRQVPEGPVLRGLSRAESRETEGSFTVGIASKSAANIPFNWLIIN